MHWKLYKDNKPSSGERCVVAYVSNGKVCCGIFAYNQSGSNCYWTSNSNVNILCKDNQQWYYVNDIINSVLQRLEDEISAELHRGRL